LHIKKDFYQESRNIILMDSISAFFYNYSKYCSVTVILSYIQKYQLFLTQDALTYMVDNISAFQAELNYVY
jgi:hypothetical protein